MNMLFCKRGVDMRELRYDLPVQEIAPDVYWINEFEGTNCYLVVGEEKALLIDCGTGFCDLRKCIENITDKPIVLAMTHGHVDHFGGAGQFRYAYLHPADMTAINEFQKKRILRQIFLLQSNAYPLGFRASDVFQPEFETKYIPMKDGKIFELGGKIVSVKHTPGHSRGSVSFVDETDKIVFCGDNMCDALWMFVPGAASLEEWLATAQWLYEKSEDHRIFWGHRKPELSREYIHTVMEWGREIIEKNPENSRFYSVAQYPDREDGIIYRRDNIHKKC